MPRRLFAVALLVGCGGTEDPPAGQIDPPELLADDLRPYELPAGCAELPTWPELRAIERVAVVSAREAWVVTADQKLFHLQPDGSMELDALAGVRDVRRCEGVTWAVGAAGLVARKPDGGDWERLDLVMAPPYTDVEDAGIGCDDQMWLGLGLAVHVHDGTAWRAIPTEPTYFDPANPEAGKIEHETYVVRGAADYRVATSHFGETLAYFPERDAFAVVAGTDDAISDAIAFRDGTGATLYNGHALAFDRDADHNDGDSALDGDRAARRSDADIWIATSGDAVHFDGTAVTPEPLPGFFDADIDARFDAVWAVGFDGIAAKTQAAWCHVLITPRLP
jgi:hypothetical protein